MLKYSVPVHIIFGHSNNTQHDFITDRTWKHQSHSTHMLLCETQTHLYWFFNLIKIPFRDICISSYGHGRFLKTSSETGCWSCFCTSFFWKSVWVEFILSDVSDCMLEINTLQVLIIACSLETHYFYSHILMSYIFWLPKNILINCVKGKNNVQGHIMSINYILLFIMMCHVICEV